MRMLTFLFCVAFVLGLSSVVTAAVHRVPSQYPTIQSGIDAAVGGDTVLVADGTYTGDGNRDLDFGGVNMVVMSENGPEVTIIDCEGSLGDEHRGFSFHNGEDHRAVVRGFTIQHGWANYGGAIYCSHSSPTIEGNVITESTIDGAWVGHGAGIYCCYSSAAIIGNRIVANRAAYGEGGGIACFASSPRIAENIIADNWAFYGGGGLHCSYWSSPDIDGNLIVGNWARGYGGALHCDDSSPPINGNTITGNVGEVGGGGIFCHYSSAEIMNSILWGNSAGIAGSQIYLYCSSSIAVSCCDLEGGSPAVYTGPGSTLYWGPGNLDEDPLFVTGPFGDFYLSQTAAGQTEQSPCIDAGHVRSPVPLGTTRTDEVLDVWPVDMGYHYPSSLVRVEKEERTEIAVTGFYLGQNHPNPFSSVTRILYSVAAPTSVTLCIYDIRGALVRTMVSGEQLAGRHQVDWDGRDQHGHRVGSGVYFCHLSVGGHAETKRMVLLR